MLRRTIQRKNGLSHHAPHTTKKEAQWIAALFRFLRQCTCLGIHAIGQITPNTAGFESHPEEQQQIQAVLQAALPYRLPSSKSCGAGGAMVDKDTAVSGKSQTGELLCKPPMFWNNSSQNYTSFELYIHFFLSSSSLQNSPTETDIYIKVEVQFPYFPIWVTIFPKSLLKSPLFPQ